MSEEELQLREARVHLRVVVRADQIGHTPLFRVILVSVRRERSSTKKLKALTTRIACRPMREHPRVEVAKVVAGVVLSLIAMNTGGRSSTSIASNKLKENREAARLKGLPLEISQTHGMTSQVRRTGTLLTHESQGVVPVERKVRDVASSKVTGGRAGPRLALLERIRVRIKTTTIGAIIVEVKPTPRVEVRVRTIAKVEERAKATLRKATKVTTVEGSRVATEGRGEAPTMAVTIPVVTGIGRRDTVRMAVMVELIQLRSITRFGITT